jgi:septal ring factor EnvC (AmiA/AmiB activator)
MKIDNIKEEVTHDMENIRKKWNRNTKLDGNPLQQTKISRKKISELEDEIGIKGKTEELLFKQLKTCEKNMEELTNSIKEQTWESWAFLKKE